MNVYTKYTAMLVLAASLASMLRSQESLPGTGIVLQGRLDAHRVLLDSFSALSPCSFPRTYAYRPAARAFLMEVNAEYGCRWETRRRSLNREYHDILALLPAPTGEGPEQTPTLALRRTRDLHPYDRFREDAARSYLEDDFTALGLSLMVLRVLSDVYIARH